MLCKRFILSSRLYCKKSVRACGLSVGATLKGQTPPLTGAESPQVHQAKWQDWALSQVLLALPVGPCMPALQPEGPHQHSTIRESHAFRKCQETPSLEAYPGSRGLGAQPLEAAVNSPLRGAPHLWASDAAKNLGPETSPRPALPQALHPSRRPSSVDAELRGFR